MTSGLRVAAFLSRHLRCAPHERCNLSWYFFSFSFFFASPAESISFPWVLNLTYSFYIHSFAAYMTQVTLARDHHHALFRNHWNRGLRSDSVNYILRLSLEFASAKPYRRGAFHAESFDFAVVLPGIAAAQAVTGAKAEAVKRKS